MLLNCHVGIQLLFLRDLLSYILQFLYQALLALLECSHLVPLLFNECLRHLEVTKISDLRATSFDAVAGLDQELLDFLPERVVIFLCSQLSMELVQLLYFLLDLLHLSLDYLLLALRISRYQGVG